jgi:hypothetical protein
MSGLFRAESKQRRRLASPDRNEIIVRRSLARHHELGGAVD